MQNWQNKCFKIPTTIPTKILMKKKQETTIMGRQKVIK